MSSSNLTTVGVVLFKPCGASIQTPAASRVERCISMSAVDTAQSHLASELEPGDAWSEGAVGFDSEVHKPPDGALPAVAFG
jgi:hypothetical protein